MYCTHQNGACSGTNSYEGKESSYYTCQGLTNRCTEIIPLSKEKQVVEPPPPPPKTETFKSLIVQCCGSIIPDPDPTLKH
jgi:hypothetical protein